MIRPIHIMHNLPTTPPDLWVLLTAPLAMKHCLLKEIRPLKTEPGFETVIEVQTASDISRHQLEALSATPPSCLLPDWRYD